MYYFWQSSKNSVCGVQSDLKMCYVAYACVLVKSNLNKTLPMEVILFSRNKNLIEI